MEWVGWVLGKFVLFDVEGVVVRKEVFSKCGFRFKNWFKGVF